MGVFLFLLLTKLSTMDQALAITQEVAEAARHFVENLDELIIQQIDPVKKAQFFKVIFDRMPSSDNLDLRNTKTPFLQG